MTWRTATADDAAALRDLEREANLVGLAHVFRGLPFPDEGVLARWRDTLADPAVHGAHVTEVAFTSWDDAGRLRHLAVHPDRWGTGLAREGVALAVGASAPPDATPVLWVLAANHRARGLYEHLGWEPTGREQPAEWPPYPGDRAGAGRSGRREGGGHHTEPEGGVGRRPVRAPGEATWSCGPSTRLTAMVRHELSVEVEGRVDDRRPDHAARAALEGRLRDSLEVRWTPTDAPVAVPQARQRHRSAAEEDRDRDRVGEQLRSPVAEEAWTSV